MLLYPAPTAFILAIIGFTRAYTPCPIHGPSFPYPTNLCDAPALQNALRNLTETLDYASKTGRTKFGEFPSNLTSFSIGVFDASSPDLLFAYDHSAPTLSSTGTQHVTTDSVFRIGSGSKLISIYVFLIEAGAKYWNHPVTDFVPQLKAAARSCEAAIDPLDCVDWNDVTLGALASHMAVIGRDYSAQGELLYSLPIDFGVEPDEVGLPELQPSAYPPCGWNTTDACPEDEFLRGFTARHPIFAPFTTPIYSNAAFQLLEFALENITGRSFPDMVDRDLFGKLDMKHSGYYIPANLSYSAIPYDPTTSGFDTIIGNETPVGGYYSSATDLARMGQSILSSSLLSPSATRQWMKPVTFTSSIRQGVGMPWEIWRVTDLTDHIFELYTKSGDIFLYSSLFALSPDYNVGFVVLATGNDTTASVEYLSDTVAATVFPALGQTARSQASRYTGFYKSNITALDSNITISIQSGKPGLVVDSWYSNGTDFLGALATVEGAEVDMRMYPTGLIQQTSATSQRIGFRAAIWPSNSVPDGGVFSSDCETWVTVDGYMYGEVGIDDFVFDIRDNEVISIDTRSLRVTLPKVL